MWNLLHWHRALSLLLLALLVFSVWIYAAVVVEAHGELPNQSLQWATVVVEAHGELPKQLLQWVDTTLILTYDARGHIIEKPVAIRNTSISPIAQVTFRVLTRDMNSLGDPVTITSTTTVIESDTIKWFVLTGQIAKLPQQPNLQGYVRIRTWQGTISNDIPLTLNPVGSDCAVALLSVVISLALAFLFVCIAWCSIIGVLVIIAPLCYSAFAVTTPESGAKGRICFFLLTSLITLWAVYGQIMLSGVLISELAYATILSDSARCAGYGFLVLTGLLIATYAIRSIRDTVINQPPRQAVKAEVATALVDTVALHLPSGEGDEHTKKVNAARALVQAGWLRPSIWDPDQALAESIVDIVTPHLTRGERTTPSGKLKLSMP